MNIGVCSQIFSKTLDKWALKIKKRNLQSVFFEQKGKIRSKLKKHPPSPIRCSRTPMCWTVTNAVLKIKVQKKTLYFLSRIPYAKTRKRTVAPTVTPHRTNEYKKKDRRVQETARAKNNVRNHKKTCIFFLSIYQKRIFYLKFAEK